jgi:hypothetical protein
VIGFIFGSLPKKSPCEPHIDPCLDVLLSNIAQSKNQHFTAEFARTARKTATETRIQGCDPGLGMHPKRVDWGCRTRVKISGNVSNFEQASAVHIRSFGSYRGIAMSGPNPTPPSIIGLGGVALSPVS